MDNITLLKSFRRIKKSYYGITIPSTIFQCKDSELACKEFINKHFTDGCKAEVLEVPFRSQLEECGKHCHTVSLYLMGLLSEDFFKERLKTKLVQIMNITGWYDFKYTWFLTCMYHDIASCIENTQVKVFAEKRQLDFYLGMFNIQFTPYKYFPRKENVCLTRFSEELIKNYFCYRMEGKSLEHGIIGGYLLFDKFYKNFCEKTKNVEWKENDFEIIENLHWRREHIDHSAYIADAIICHNLWLSYDDSSKKIYEKYGLNPLIVSEEDGKNKLLIDAYPLQFLLCLLDTIEPVKRFRDLEPEEVLASIGIKFEKNGLRITWEQNIGNQSQFEGWKKGIQELQKWMGVEVEAGKREFELIINFGQ